MAEKRADVTTAVDDAQARFLQLARGGGARESAYLLRVMQMKDMLDNLNASHSSDTAISGVPATDHLFLMPHECTNFKTYEEFHEHAVSELDAMVGYIRKKSGNNLILQRRAKVLSEQKSVLQRQLAAYTKTKESLKFLSSEQRALRRIATKDILGLITKYNNEKDLTDDQSWTLLDQLQKHIALHPPLYEETQSSTRIANAGEKLYKRIGEAHLRELARHNIHPSTPTYNTYEGVASTISLQSVEADLNYSEHPTFDNWKKKQHALQELEHALLTGAFQEHARATALGKVIFRLNTCTGTYRLASNRVSTTAKAEIEDAEFQQLFQDLTPAAKTKKRSEKKQTTPASKSTQTEPTAEDVSPFESAIQAAVNDKKNPVRFEGETANLIQQQLLTFGEITGFNTIVRSGNRIVTEFDILLENAIVECSLRSRGKYEQIRRRAENVDNLNPLHKHVILYVPNYTDAEMAHVLSLNSPNNAKVTVVRTSEELRVATEGSALDGFVQAARATKFVT